MSGRRLLLAAVALVAGLAGCATRPPTVPLPGADGPEERPPPGLLQVPDALPQLEPIRLGGPNKPYAVLGESYVPLPAETVYREHGLASWYGRKFHGRPTASGERYDMYAMSAAHKTLPIPSYVRVTNPANARSVIVRVNDRGPFVRGRIIDLSYTAALKLDLLRGVAPVTVERITPEDIRSGAWQAAAAPATMPPLPVVIDGADPPPAPPPADPAPTAAAGRGFWVQLGAFRDRAGAQHLQQRSGERVEGLGLLLAVFSEGAWHRVQAGPFATREQAARMAEQLRERLGALVAAPVVVERR
jgi:rare lipoprotein A